MSYADAETSVDVFVIERDNVERGWYLLRTDDGEPVWTRDLLLARLFLSMKAVRNQRTRFKGERVVRYTRVRLTVLE